MNKNLIPSIFITLLTASLIIFKNPLESRLVSFWQRPKINELGKEEYVKKILSQNGEYDNRVKTAFFDGQKITIPEGLSQLPISKNVLGLQAYATEGEKWIEIDLDNQRLYAHEGDRVVYEFPISSGLPWTPTVTGEFRIWVKLKYTRMTGGCEVNDCYDLPNVPYTQYFYKGYGLHGTYWHNDFGRPKSHGCVNLQIPDAEKLFYWTLPPVTENHSVKYPTKDYPGTKVVIYGKARI